jgi:hypothetical protein
LLPPQKEKNILFFECVLLTLFWKKVSFYSHGKPTGCFHKDGSESQTWLLTSSVHLLWPKVEPQLSSSSNYHADSKTKISACKWSFSFKVAAAHLLVLNWWVYYIEREFCLC